MFNKILLATDGSECALHATETAIDIAKSNPNVMIHIVYVINISNVKADVLQNWNSIGTQGTRNEKVKLTEELIKAADINYQIHFLRGDPGPTIVKYAHEENCDLVIVGSRGKNKLQELVLGSVSHKVAKRVRCPVIIVKGKYNHNPKNVNTIKNKSTSSNQIKA